MFAVYVEVDNRGESRDDRFRGLREEVAPAMKQSAGEESGIFASDETNHVGYMVLVYDTREHAGAVAGRIVVGSSPRPGVTVKRIIVAEVAASF